MKLHSLLLSFSVLNSFVSSLPAPTPIPNLLETALLSRSNTSSGRITLPLKRHKTPRVTKRAEGQPVSDYDNNALYSVKVTIGQPASGSPQVFDLILHTFTGRTTVLDQNYDAKLSLPDGVKKFDSSKSTTYHSTGKTFGEFLFSTEYVEGEIVQDKFSFPPYQIDNFVFSKATSGNYSEALDGVFGLGWSSESDDAQDNGSTIPFVETLWRQGLLSEPLFSLTLFDQSTNSNSGLVDGGQITLGGIPEELVDSVTGITYSPLESVDGKEISTYWQANVQKVTSGSSEQDSSFDVLFDMAQPYSVFPFEVFQNILAGLNLSNLYYPYENDDSVIGGYVECDPNSNEDILGLSVTIAGVEYPFTFSSVIQARYLAPDGSTYCDLGITGDRNINAVRLGADFLSNVVSVFRFDPPSIGLGLLSEQGKGVQPHYNPLPASSTFSGILTNTHVVSTTVPSYSLAPPLSSLSPAKFSVPNLISLSTSASVPTGDANAGAPTQATSGPSSSSHSSSALSLGNPNLFMTLFLTFAFALLVPISIL